MAAFRCVVNLSVTVLVLSTVLLQTVSVAQAAKHPGVTVLNSVGGDLQLHCKSHDDDLGQHNLHNTEMYHFDVHPNVFGSTKFNCEFSWNSHHAEFPVWGSMVVPVYLISVAAWKVQPDGFWYYYTPTNVWQNRYQWSPDPTAAIANQTNEELSG